MEFEEVVNGKNSKKWGIGKEAKKGSDKSQLTGHTQFIF